MLCRLAFQVQQLARLTGGRMRARLFGFLGANVGTKCTFGTRVRIDRPWTVSLGHRSTLESDVWIKVVQNDAQVDIGDFTFLGRGVELDVSERVCIGNHVLIAPGVLITDHNHNIQPARLIDSQGCCAAPVSIEDDVWIGAHAVILAGVTIGRGAVVGAGAVVTRSVPPNVIVGGVPAREINKRTADGIRLERMVP